MRDLTEDVLDMVRGMAHKAAPSQTVAEDLMQVGTEAAWLHVGGYRSEVGKLTTYLHPFILGAMMRELAEHQLSSGLRVPSATVERVRAAMAGVEDVPVRGATVRAALVAMDHPLVLSPDGASATRMQEDSSPGDLAEPDTTDVAMELSAPSAEEEAMAEMGVTALLDGGGLTERQRLVIQLTVLSTMDDKDVADRLMVDRSTVTRERSRALRALRATLAAAEASPEEGT